MRFFSPTSRRHFCKKCELYVNYKQTYNFNCRSLSVFLRILVFNCCLDSYSRFLYHCLRMINFYKYSRTIYACFHPFSTSLMEMSQRRVLTLYLNVRFKWIRKLCMILQLIPLRCNLVTLDFN